MLIGSCRKLSKVNSISVLVHSCAVETVEEFKYLGVTFSSGMTLVEHIDKISSKINKRLCLLKRIKHLLSQFARVLYFNSFVLPLFDYRDMIWRDKNNNKLMQRLQILQNKAAKIILGWPVHFSTTDVLRALNWFNLSKRRLYHRCLYFSKCKTVC